MMYFTPLLCTLFHSNHRSKMFSIANSYRAIAAHMKHFCRSRTRPSLLNLPNELLLQIARSLAPDIASLNALLRTTRFLSVFLRPVLYTYATTALVSSGTSPLRASCAAGKIHSVRSLLAHGVPSDKRELNSGTTPLHAAIMLGQAAVVEVMLQEGVDVNQADENGWTPLHWAVISGERSIAHTLLVRGARMDARGRFGGGGTPLHLAVGRRAAGGQMSRLLLEWGAGVDVRDHCGNTPMQYGAAVRDQEVVALMLQQRGSSVGPSVRARDCRCIKQRVQICKAWWQVCVLTERSHSAEWVEIW